MSNMTPMTRRCEACGEKFEGPGKLCINCLALIFGITPDQLEAENKKRREGAASHKRREVL